MGKRIIVRTKEAVGGATRINAMLHTRGFPGGYELWRRALEQPASAENETQDGPPHPPIRDWSWAAVEPIFQQLENATRVNARLRVSDSTPASTSSSSSPRGTSGEVSVGRHAYPWRHYSYWERSAQALNLPVVTDLNDPAAPSMGYAHLDHLVDDRGFRASAYSMFLPKAVALERKRWLTVCTNVVATGLKFADGDSDERGREADGERIVTGVHVKMNGSSDGRTFFIRARREVIVCCGTICTPQLLMLRCVWPVTSMQRTEALTVDQWHRRPCRAIIAQDRMPHGPAHRRREPNRPRGCPDPPVCAASGDGALDAAAVPPCGTMASAALPCSAPGHPRGTVDGACAVPALVPPTPVTRHDDASTGRPSRAGIRRPRPGHAARS